MNSIGGIFITAFLIGFSGAITPGPVLTVTISESARRGFWAGPLIVLGHGILEFLLFIAVARGAGQFLTLPTVKATISFLGGAVLIWFGAVMAWQSYRTRLSFTAAYASQGSDISVPSKQVPSPSVSNQDQSPSASYSSTSSSATSCTWAEQASNPVVAGFLLSISNPYWTIWWATIGLSYIALSLPFGRWGLTSFYCGHILADLSWHSFISGFIALGKKSFSPCIYHLIILFCGIFLLIFGIYFSYSGFHFLFR